MKNDKKKIIVVTNFYPPHEIGGYEIRCRDTVEYLKNQGHDVTVLTSYYGLRRKTVSNKVFRVLRATTHGFNKLFNKWPMVIFFHYEVAVFRAMMFFIKPDLIYIFNMQVR